MPSSILNEKHPSQSSRPERVTRFRRDNVRAIGRVSLMACLCWIGCGAPQAAPSPDPAPAPAPAPSPDETETERQQLTSEQCEAQGGEVVGDIGDGATSRPDYVCPSGKPPAGNIAPPEGGPMPVEGSVCCPR